MPSAKPSSAASLDTAQVFDQMAITAADLKKVEKVTLACGASWHAALVGSS